MQESRKLCSANVHDISKSLRPSPKSLILGILHTVMDIQRRKQILQKYLYHTLGKLMKTKQTFITEVGLNLGW